MHPADQLDSKTLPAASDLWNVKNWKQTGSRLHVSTKPFTRDHKNLVDCQSESPSKFSLMAEQKSFTCQWISLRIFFLILNHRLEGWLVTFPIHLEIDFPSVCRLAKSDGSCPSTVTDKVDGLPAAAPAALRAATKAMTSAWWGSIANRRCIDKWLCCSLTMVMMRTVVMLTILIILTRLGEE